MINAEVNTMPARGSTQNNTNGQLKYSGLVWSAHATAVLHSGVPTKVYSLLSGLPRFHILKLIHH